MSQETKRMEISKRRSQPVLQQWSAAQRVVQCWRGAEAGSRFPPSLTYWQAKVNQKNHSDLPGKQFLRSSQNGLAGLTLVSCSMLGRAARRGNDGGSSEAAPACSSKVLEQENAFGFLKVWLQVLICMVHTETQTWSFLITVYHI